MTLKTSGKWKSVDLDPFLQSKGFSEGLLGIEELCDYDLLKVKKNKLVSVEGSKVTKIHQFETVASPLKISEDINCRTLFILYFRTNETNSPMGVYSHRKA